MSEFPQFHRGRECIQEAPCYYDIGKYLGDNSGLYSHSLLLVSVLCLSEKHLVVLIYVTFSRESVLLTSTGQHINHGVLHTKILPWPSTVTEELSSWGLSNQTRARSAFQLRVPNRVEEVRKDWKYRYHTYHTDRVIYVDTLRL